MKSDLRITQVLAAVAVIAYQVPAGVKLNSDTAQGDDLGRIADAFDEAAGITAARLRHGTAVKGVPSDK